ncbi:MAG: class I SAM-dependent methyltransferase [Methanomicrobiales archaeon]|nr:class I SAM-dependent methyltransferase [Methanomicrobiales archaeon]
MEQTEGNNAKRAGAGMGCPYCRSTDTHTFLESRLPNISSACPAEMLHLVRIFPFRVNICHSCGLGFNTTPLKEDQLRLIYDHYTYISPMDHIGHTAYRGMVDTLMRHVSREEHLVEIGCSEGFVLHELRKAGYIHLTGVDPAPQAERAIEQGLRIVRSYFDEGTLGSERVDVFVLMHVFEHFPDPFRILTLMLSRLAPSGRIVIEVPDLGGYHHQHLFYYSIPFFARLCRDYGLKIVEVTRDMDALRLVIARSDDDSHAGVPVDGDIGSVIARAGRIGADQREKMRKIEEILTARKGETVYWWGAGSASTVILNQMSPEILSRVNLIVVDGDRRKAGLFVPGVNLGIHSFEILRNREIGLLVIGSSFYDEIQETLRDSSILPEEIHVVY